MLMFNMDAQKKYSVLPPVPLLPELGGDQIISITLLGEQ